MLKDKKHMKVISLAAAAMMVVSMASTAVSADAASVNTKEETVYVITDDTGTQTELIVCDHLVNSAGSGVLNDISSLENIENVKGDEKFTQKKDGTLKWEAGGNDIYYQGSTDKKPPVTMKIKYFLDGREVKAEDLKGKSGKVKISIEYSNSHQETVGNDTCKVPFVVVSGMIIEDDCFRNVEVSSGKVIDDGEKQFVVGMSVPGLSESLGLSEEETGLSDTVEITGEADNFSISDMMSIVTNDFFRDIDMDELGDMDPDSQINALDKAARELEKGTRELYEGIETLNDKSGQLTGGVSALTSGAKKLKDGTDSAVEGSSRLAAGAASLSESVNEKLIPGVESLAAGSSQVAQGAQQIASKVGNTGSTDSSTLVGGAAQLSAGLNGNEGLKNSYSNVLAYSRGTVDSTLQLLGALKESGAVTEEQYNQIAGALNQSVAYQEAVKSSIDQLAAGAGALYSGTQSLAAGINGDGTAENPGLVNGAGAVSSGTQQLLAEVKGTAEDTQSLASGSKSLSDGTAQLAAGQQQLNEGARALAAGMAQLEKSTGKLISGVDALDIGALKLHRGMQQFYDEGISKIVELYNSNIKGIAEGMDSLVNAGKQYDIFTQKDAGTESSVKFIYRTSIIPEE